MVDAKLMLIIIYNSLVSLEQNQSSWAVSSGVWMCLSYIHNLELKNIEHVA